MTDKTDLNSDIIVLSAKMMSICSKEKCHPDEIEDCVYSHAEKIKKTCIESDEAREYWRVQDYDIQQRAVQLAVLVERTHFIEQACEAVDKLPSSCGINLVCKDSVKQAIRDRLK